MEIDFNFFDVWVDTYLKICCLDLFTTEITKKKKSDHVTSMCKLVFNDCNTLVSGLVLKGLTCYICL